MKTVVTAEQMRFMDQQTIDQIGISGIVLMENAGAGTARYIMDAFAPKQALIFCGKGNNGGDGFVIGRHLADAGVEVNLILIGSRDAVTGDAWVNLSILDQSGISVTEVLSEDALQSLSGCDLIVDALLGTGITGIVRGLTGDVIQWINRQEVPVVAVDLPSGLNGNTGQFEGPCVEADATCTMAFLKRGLLIEPGRFMAGDVNIIDISIPAAVEKNVEGLCFLSEAGDIETVLPRRPVDGHKGTFGKVGVIAGSVGMSGAAVLTSTAVLRTGAGMAACGCPKSINMILENKMTEVMTRPLGLASAPVLTWDTLEDIQELFKWADVAAMGPGLSDDPETGDLIRELAGSLGKPFVLDADGINAFVGNLKALKRIQASCILTPHAGELARLLKVSVSEILEDPVQMVIHTARSLEQVVVLKGAPTLIADADGHCRMNPTGNCGMGTAGSGDVLTGMIAGLLAQGASPFEAAYGGVYLHGLAGDLAAASLSEQAMMAEDILSHIGKAFQHLEALCCDAC